MKRIVSILAIFSMIFGLVAFQCSSTELTSAKLYIQQKNLEKAKESLQKEVEKNSSSDEGFYLLGYVYGEEGNMVKMIENFNRSLKISSKFKDNIVDTKKFHWQNNFNKGVSLFNRGAKSTSEDTSQIYFSRAIDAFNSAILCEPDSVDSYKNLVYAYLNANRADDAIDPLQKIISINKDSDSYAMLGEIYYNNGILLMNEYAQTNNTTDSLNAMEWFEKTIKLTEEGRKLYPENSDILLILSNAYVNANKLDVAMEAFHAGVLKNPDNKYYRYNYGVLLLGADKFEDAVEQFSKAIEIDAAYVNALYNLGVSYVKWGSELREESVEINEEDTAYLEKFKLSLEPLKKYVELNPEDGKVWELLGKVYANLGMSDESKEAFEKADLYR